MVPLCEGTVIAGKYRLERAIATGGMGAVWAARHLALDAPVAVKFMSPSLPRLAEARRRFAREARVAARLRGPHVVEILDHGEDHGSPYIVMELLEGEHLGELLRREGRLGLDDAAALAAQVAAALGRAHRAGIVHRDLKPANVFLAAPDDAVTDAQRRAPWVVKVLDFGIHKALGDTTADVTLPNLLMGSPQYMSPEQARGGVVDQRADVWSLGAILFRAVTGVAAFDGISGVDIVVAVCSGPLPTASRVADGVPNELDAFFWRALARDPKARFASARDLADAFAQLVAVCPPSARRARPQGHAPSAASEEGPTRRIATGAGEEPPRRFSWPTSDVNAFVDGAFSALQASIEDDAAGSAAARARPSPPLDAEGSAVRPRGPRIRRAPAR